METNKILDTSLLIDHETGLTTIFNIIEYPKAPENPDNDVIWPTRNDYVTAIEIMVSLLQLGKPIPSIDVIISAMCLNRRITLVTRDQHFKYVKSVKRELSLKIKSRKKIR